jgi:hypothetical protein
MKTTTAILLLLVTAFTGCMSVQQPPQSVVTPKPPYPPGFTPRRIAPSTVTRSAQVSAPEMAPPPPTLPNLTNMIYIEMVDTYALLSWVTNTDTRSFVIWSPDLKTPMEMWRVPSHHKSLLSTNGNMAQLKFTNDVRSAFFKLITVPTNVLSVGWEYDFVDNMEVGSFVLRYGNQSGVYQGTNNIPGRRLWSTVAIPDTKTNWYFRLSAKTTNNVESVPAIEVHWPSSSLTLSWEYNYVDAVDSFVLYYGNQSGDYRYSQVVSDRQLSTKVVLPTLKTNWFFAVTARANGTESVPSAEASWSPPP